MLFGAVPQVVCRAWHSTNEVLVLVPGIRGAEGWEFTRGGEEGQAPSLEATSAQEGMVVRQAQYKSAWLWGRTLEGLSDKKKRGPSELLFAQCQGLTPTHVEGVGSFSVSSVSSVSTVSSVPSVSTALFANLRCLFSSLFFFFSNSF